jgi:hypothetical protein
VEIVGDAGPNAPAMVFASPSKGSRAVARPPASRWRLNTLSKADALGRLGALPGVAGRGHGIVGLEPELLAVGFRRELVRNAEMAPKGFLLLAANQTGEVFVSNRAAHSDGGLRLGWLGLLSTEGIQSVADRTDQIAQIGHGEGVPADVGDDDLGCELGD